MKQLRLISFQGISLGEIWSSLSTELESINRLKSMIKSELEDTGMHTAYYQSEWIKAGNMTKDRMSFDK